MRALCQNPNGGIPATFLSSQQSEAEAVAVKKELSKVGDCNGALRLRLILLVCVYKYCLGAIDNNKVTNLLSSQ